MVKTNLAIHRLVLHRAVAGDGVTCFALANDENLNVDENGGDASLALNGFYFAELALTLIGRLSYWIGRDVYGAFRGEVILANPEAVLPGFDKGKSTAACWEPVDNGVRCFPVSLHDLSLAIRIDTNLRSVDIDSIRIEPTLGLLGWTMANEPSKTHSVLNKICAELRIELVWESGVLAAALENQTSATFDW